MARSSSALSVLVCFAVLEPAPPAVAEVAEAVHHDDCDSAFLAFIGADAYQFSPLLAGELGSVRLFAILSYQQAASSGDPGRAFWRLEVRGPGDSDALVAHAEGVARIEAPRGTELAEAWWDGRDLRGAVAREGLYRYTFFGRFLPDRVAPARPIAGYDDLAGVPGVEPAEMVSSDEVVVNHALDERTSSVLRSSLTLAGCERQINIPLEAGFPYNFYYGSTHSHSNFSDGGQSLDVCSSGRAYGSGSYAPADTFAYARHTAGLDYWVVNEHNHLIDDAVANNAPPLTAAKVRQRYQDGLAAATSATADGAFVAVYGMEWGVTTNPDQGHVTLLETPVLFGWEPCTSCNGPLAECSPGVDCLFDVFTPKRFGYLDLYKRSIEHPSPAGALGILCHPASGNFDNYAFNADADEALQGTAVRSGLAFTTADVCSDVNVGSLDYTARWKDALNRGFHLGPTAEHDAHCNNGGTAIPNRTVYLLPGAQTPALTKIALLEAHKRRHFFATEDANAQLVFAVAGSGQIMGDIFSRKGSLTLRAEVYDPSGEGVARMELWRGQPGRGIPTAPYHEVLGQPRLSKFERPRPGTYYYFIHAVQADGHDMWSAPMWITYTSR